MRRRLLVLAAIVYTVPCFAAENAALVLEQVLRAQRLGRNTVLASRTAGGGELTVTDFVVGHYGRAIGFEVGDLYVAQNRERHSLRELLNASSRFVFVDLATLPPDAATWEEIVAQAPGTAGVVLVSRPAFDQAERIAVVRVDTFIRGRHRTNASTMLYLLERQANGEWKIGLISTGGGYEMVHSNTNHRDRHLPKDYDYYHARQD